MKITLNRTGKRLLERHHALQVRLRATQAGASGASTTLANQVVTLVLPRKTRR